LSETFQRPSAFLSSNPQVDTLVPSAALSLFFHVEQREIGDVDAVIFDYILMIISSASSEMGKSVYLEILILALSLVRLLLKTPSHFHKL
jgi:hypothetical protein